MKTYTLLALFIAPQTILATLELSPAEYNARIIGDAKGRPEGHRTVPYAEGLPDPYRKFAEEADPVEVLGE